MMILTISHFKINQDNKMTEKRKAGRPKIEGGSKSISVCLSHETINKLNILAEKNMISRHALMVSLIRGALT